MYVNTWGGGPHLVRLLCVIMYSTPAINCLTKLWAWALAWRLIWSIVENWDRTTKPPHVRALSLKERSNFIQWSNMGPPKLKYLTYRLCSSVRTPLGSLLFKKKNCLFNSQTTCRITVIALQQKHYWITINSYDKQPHSGGEQQITGARTHKHTYLNLTSIPYSSLFSGRL